MYTLAEVGSSFQRITIELKTGRNKKMHKYKSQEDSVYPSFIIIIMTLHYFLKI